MANNPMENIPQLDDAAAGAIMANVFAACELEPSTIPLSVLRSYTEYRRDRYALQKNIVLFMLVVFLLLPLCFIAPRFRVDQIGRSAAGVPTYEVKVSNLIPVRLVSARLNGRSVAVYESEARVFTIEPMENGKLTVTVTLANHQFDVWSTEVTGVDAHAPTLDSSMVVGDNIRIYVRDDGVGVDHANAYAVTNIGNKVAPVDYSEEEGYVEFLFDQNLNIFIPDANGNTLQLVLTIK